MAKAKKAIGSSRVYLTKRRLASAARSSIRAAATHTMQIMGYTVVVEDGWIVKKHADGTIEKLKPLASQEESAHITLD